MADTPEVEQMAQHRLYEVESITQKIKPENFATEEEYRTALLDGYQKLREKEYETTVKDECLKVYNINLDGKKRGISNNVGTCTGYQQAPELNKLVADSALIKSQENASMCLYGNLRPLTITNLNSCALTAASICQKVSNEMDYANDQNLMQVKYRGAKPGLKGNILAAQGLAHSVPSEYSFTPKTRVSTRELIANGTLNAGDTICVPTGRGATNTSTGYHAMTIADVQKDENGNVTGYIMQGSNNNQFSYYSINDKNPKLMTNRPLYNAVICHQWIQDKITEEIDNLKNLPTAELEQTLAKTKERTVESIKQLQETEKYNFEKGYNAGYKNNYLNRLEEKKQQEMQPESEISNTDIHKQLKSQLQHRTEQQNETAAPAAQNTKPDTDNKIVDMAELENSVEAFSFDPNKQSATQTAQKSQTPKQDFMTLLRAQAAKQGR